MRYFSCSRVAAIAASLTLFTIAISNACPLLGQPIDDHEFRTWSDSTGKFEVTAKLVTTENDEVVLVTETGREIRVAKNRLSEVDLKYLAQLSDSGEVEYDSKRSEVDANAEKAGERSSSNKDIPANEQELVEKLKSIALVFYDDLRTTERNVAIEHLTQSAREVAKQSNSELAKLPTPDDGKQSVRIGRPKIEGKSASVPVSVRVNKKVYRTILYLSQENQDWYVTAISSLDKNEENKIEFASSGVGNAKKDKLDSLVGTPIKLTGVTLDGKPVSLSSLKGKVVLIDFWATWCGPCLREIPNILENYEKYHEHGFEVLAVSTDKDLEKLSDFVEEEQPPWIVLADRHPKNKQSMAAQFEITGIPTFILVDRDGIVYAVNCRGAKLGQKLEELFSMDVSLK